MDFQHNERAAALRRRIDASWTTQVFPVEHLYREQVHASGDPATRTRTPPVLQQLKAKAREQGLWNLFLPNGDPEAPAAPPPRGSANWQSRIGPRRAARA